MPWIRQELCTGCQQCIDECSAGVITMVEELAVIDEDACIRCGVCHDVCPEDAVRHDSERIPEEVESNLKWAKTMLAHEYYAGDRVKQRQLVDRLQRFFTKNKKVMEKTIERLGELKKAEYAE